MKKKTQKRQKQRRNEKENRELPSVQIQEA